MDRAGAAPAESTDTSSGERQAGDATQATSPAAPRKVVHAVRGNNRLNAARNARSASVSRGRADRRRSTANSCRSTKISTSFDRAGLAASTISPSTHRTARYTNDQSKRPSPDSTREPNLPTPPPRISVHEFLNPTGHQLDLAVLAVELEPGRVGDQRHHRRFSPVRTRYVAVRRPGARADDAAGRRRSDRRGRAALPHEARRVGSDRSTARARFSGPEPSQPCLCEDP
jgi:hypothetical protein